MIKVALIILAVLPAPLLAGSWGAFEARCLVPYSQIFAPHADGLVPIKGDARRFALPEGGQLILGEYESCAVQNGPTLAKGFGEWLADEIAAGRFIRDVDGSALSTTWREPKMRVTLDPETNTVTAEETDLES